MHGKKQRRRQHKLLCIRLVRLGPCLNRLNARAVKASAPQAPRFGCFPSPPRAKYTAKSPVHRGPGCGVVTVPPSAPSGYHPDARVPSDCPQPLTCRWRHQRPRRRHAVQPCPWRHRRRRLHRHLGPHIAGGERSVSLLQSSGGSDGRGSDRGSGNPAALPVREAPLFRNRGSSAGMAKVAPTAIHGGSA
jgi:hypothetical protein